MTKKMSPVKYATACKVRFIEPLKGKLADAREKQRLRREEIDKGRIKKLPPADQRNDLARRAMLDMLIVCDAFTTQFEATKQIPRIVRRYFNTVCYGVAAYRTFLGRPGEWKRMLRAIIQACLDVPDCNMVLIKDHKTLRTSGVLGRLMPGDVKWMFKKLLEFATPSKSLLFEPVGRADCIQIHALGRGFASMYTPGCEPPEPTLMRKDCETAVANPANADKTKRMDEMVGTSECADRMSKRTAAMSGHGDHCQGKYYNLNDADPKRHVASAHAYIEVFIGPVVEPPVAADAAAHPTRTAEVIIEEFRKATATPGKGKAHSDNESDAGNFGDEDIYESEVEDSENDAPCVNEKRANHSAVQPSVSKASARVGKATPVRRKASARVRKTKPVRRNVVSVPDNATATAAPKVPNSKVASKADGVKATLTNNNAAADVTDHDLVKLLDAHVDQAVCDEIDDEPRFVERVTACTSAMSMTKIRAAVEAAERDAACERDCIDGSVAAVQG